MSVEAWMDLTGEEVLQELRAMGLPAFRGKQFDLGTYTTLEDAVKARRAAEMQIFGEFLEQVE